MMRFSHVLTGIILLVSLALLSPHSAHAQTFDIETKRGIVYGTGGDEKLMLDLATPKGAEGLRPAIVFIHGGGWAAGNRAHHLSHIQDAARRGYVSVTITYRLATDKGNQFPAQVEDVKCAVRWLRSQAKELNIDPKRIGAIGFSAGAHLAMMLGTMDKDDGLEGKGGSPDQSSKVQAVVSYFGPTDLTLPYPPASERIVRKFIGGSKEEKADAYKKASPINYVNTGDAPMLLFQGTKDVLVPYQQAFVMAEALSKAGVPGRVELLLGRNHGWRGKEITRTVDAGWKFFDRYLAE
jgi:acetyl esterase/lipase